MKILVFDIESFPNLAFTWGIYEQNVIKVIRAKMVCSIAWMWLDEGVVHVRSLASYKGYKKNPFCNYELMKEFHAVISKADIVMGYNGDKFDIRMINTEFVRHKMKPTPPYKTIDPLKVNRAKFNFNSNKLDDICRELGLTRKVKHEGFAMWEKSYFGDMKAWKKMMAYNKGDVPSLRDVYLRIRAWMTNHPNVSVLDFRVGCPKCGGQNLKRDGEVIVGINRHPRFRCKDCHGWCRGKFKDGKWRYR